MQQSKYTQISKGLGWRLQYVDIPTPDRAEQLLKLVRQADEAAFTEVFKVYRFACTAETSDEFEALRIIMEAFCEGERIFREVEA